MKEVAAELEGMPGYRPRNANDITAKIGMRKGGRVEFEAVNQSKTDYEGDITIGGTNAILAAIQNLLSVNEKGVLSNSDANNINHEIKKDADRARPRAPWRSPKDFNKLREDGLCTCCTKKGHISWKFPNFRPAKGEKLNLNSIDNISRDSDSEQGNEEP